LDFFWFGIAAWQNRQLFAALSWIHAGTSSIKTKWYAACCAASAKVLHFPLLAWLCESAF
jgi:hypothetical protein